MMPKVGRVNIMVCHLCQLKSLLQIKAMMESGVPLKKIMATELLPCVGDADMPFFLTFAMRMLERHAEDMPRARVFAHAISAVATAEQWQRWHPVVKESLSPGLYEQVKAQAGW